MHRATIAAFLVALGGTLAAADGIAGPISAGGVAPATAAVCNPPDVSPSALYIGLADVGVAFAPGASLVFSVEINVTNYSPSLGIRALLLPSLTATLPLSTTGSVTSVLAPLVVTVSGPNWSSPITHTKVLTIAENFSATKSAFLSSSKIAIMANASYGAMVVAFRWSYAITPAGGNASSTITSAWSTPSATATSPYLPSQFYPAPSVSLAGTSRQPALAGSKFVVSLQGAVANTSFRIVVEYPSNGTETFSQWEATHPRTTQFNATANLSFTNGAPLPAGNYLVHVHDRCQAIVHSFTVSVMAKPVGGRVALGVVSNADLR